MNIEEFKHYIPNALSLFPVRQASVLIPILETENGPHILFQVRASELAHQPGDTCFPGGRRETDETPEDTAIRETCEELLIRPEQIELLGPSDYYADHGRIIYPFVGRLHAYEYSFSKSEVREVFSVPLSYFMNTPPDRYAVQSQLLFPEDFPFNKIQGGRKYQWSSRSEEILFWEYDGHVIWGITARILSGFMDLLH